jgi:hypothetical protein
MIPVLNTMARRDVKRLRGRRLAPFGSAASSVLVSPAPLLALPFGATKTGSEAQICQHTTGVTRRNAPKWDGTEFAPRRRGESCRPERLWAEPGPSEEDEP